MKMGYYDQNEARPTTEKRTSFFIWGVIVGILSSIVTTYLFLHLFIGEDNKEVKVTSSTVVETTITNAVDKASKSVVEILSISSNNLQQPLQSGSGSGVIYKKDKEKAYIATNHHVVAQATKLNVTLPNGEKLDAKLIGSDSLTDLAVISVDASHINDIATLGNSSKLKRGEPAIAIGNPLGYFPGSVTSGIISSTTRILENDFNQDGFSDWSTDVIQTDAAINPGNSGGALVNASGEVIGINSSKIAQESVEGIGFAIPINSALPILEQLEEHGKVKRPFLGIAMMDLQLVSDDQKAYVLNTAEDLKYGVVVLEIDPKSPASKGLEVYDIITQIEDSEIKSELDLRKALYKQQIDDEITITVIRNGEKQEVNITLFELKN